MEFSNTNYYDVLGVTQDATMDNISEAFRRRLTEEMVGNNSDLFEAYRVLSNEETRREYDEFLARSNVQVDSATDLEGFLRERAARRTVDEPEEIEEVATIEETPVIPVDTTEETIDSEENSVEPIVEDVNPVGNETSEENVAEVEAPVVSTPEAATETEAPSETPEENAEELEAPAVSTPEAATETATPSETPEENTAEAEALEENTPKHLKSKILKGLEKLKRIGKYVGGTVVGFLLLGPVGMVGVPLWLKHHEKKVKLVKDRKEKIISKLVDGESQYFENYTKVLDKEVDKLLSTPNNSYWLEINRIKYQNQIKLLASIIEVRKKAKEENPFKKFKNKLKIATLEHELNKMQEKYRGIESNIRNYNSRTEAQLLDVNRDIVRNEQELAAMAGERKNTPRFKNLQVKHSKLLEKRSKLANSVKFKLVRSDKYYLGEFKNSYNPDQQIETSGRTR